MSGQRTGITDLPRAEVQRLVHALETHQVELGAQNAELLRFQDELERSRDRFQELFDEAPFGHMVITGDGRILEANLAAADLLGVPRGRLLRRQLLFLFERRDRPALQLRLVAVARGKRRDQCELRLASAGDGAWTHVELVAPALEDGDDIRSIRVFLWDISDRRAAEYAVRAERDRLASVLKSMEDGVFIADSDYRLEYANAPLVRAFGPYDGRTCHEYLCGRDEICPWCNLKDVLRFGRTKWRWYSEKLDRVFDAVATTMRGTQSGASFLVMFRDVTESERAKEQLAGAARRKDEFLALLAHELRNPLTPLLHSTELVVSSRDEAVVAEARKIVKKQVRHMARLIDDLLDVTRISTGKITLRRSPVDLVHVLRSAAQNAEPLTEAGHVELAVELPGEPVVVDADVVRLSQLVFNLLSNAVKFTGAGGKVCLAARRAGQLARVTVSDNGVGIDSEDLPHIFEMFSQSRGGVRGQGGLGVGLALARQLVRLHDGEIHARSPGPGKGSSFVVELPLLETDTEAIPPVDTGPGDAVAAIHDEPSLRVLVVDDNEDSANALGQLLRLLGHEVRVAYDGVSGLEISAGFAPQAAVLDIGMDGLDGYGLARRLRDQPRTRAALLVALTGLGQEADRALALEAGFDHHLTKPADPAELQLLLTGHARA